MQGHYVSETIHFGIQGFQNIRTGTHRFGTSRHPTFTNLGQWQPETPELARRNPTSPFFFLTEIFLLNSLLNEKKVEQDLRLFLITQHLSDAEKKTPLVSTRLIQFLLENICSKELCSCYNLCVNVCYLEEKNMI